MLLALAAALLALGLLSARDGLASGTFKVDGLVSASHISFDGSCNPGTIAAGLHKPTIPATGDLGTGLVIPTTGTVFGCFATECFPENLIIGGELFTYSNISAATVTDIPSGSWTGDLLVQDIPGVDLDNDGDTTDPGECSAQNHIDQFPSYNNNINNNIFVGTELMHYSVRNGAHFTIDGRGSGPTAHTPDSFVRAQSLLKLKARAVPRYIGGPPTTEAAHSAGTTVSSPWVYTNCRALLLEPMGLAQVGSRSRCYFVLEPGYNPGSCPGTPASCYWPDAAIPIEEGGIPIAALQPLRSSIYHEPSEGTLTPSGPTAALHLTTQFSGLSCFEEIPGQVWVQLVTDVHFDTGLNQVDGSYTIFAYLTNPANPIASCGGTAILGIGGGNNLTYSQLSAGYDTDGDGCPDYKELNIAQGTGGLRDPFNRYDYFNPTHDHQNRVDDILDVVHQFHKDDTDSNPGLPPYTTEMQTMLNGGIGAGDTTIIVDSTAGATSTGVLLVDAERIKYTGTTPTSFTGVTRGYLNTGATSHGDNAPIAELHYDPDTDRTALGPSDWNLGKPNGQIRVDDILASVKQFHHDC